MKFILILTLLISSLLAKPITILSAANLKFFFSDILNEYCKLYPDDKITVKFDSSGKLAKNIIDGEEYDIFLAANKKYPQEVYDANKASTKPKLYTTGSIILLIASDKNLKKEGINILNNSDIREMTIANKKTAPYGMAAIEALKNAKLFNKLKSKIFYSSDASSVIGDVLWYGHTGLLPKSAVNSLPRGYNIEGVNWVEIDQKLYTPIEQYYVISKRGLQNSVTKRFIDFLLSDGQKILKQNGYK